MNYDDVKKSTLFIVDDNPENLRMAADILEGAGFIAVPIKSGMEALNLVKKRRPDLILMDIIMPGGIDGFETCRRLKNSRETGKIPVIFMSALTEPVDKVKGFNLGAVDFITKPVNDDELISRVSTHLKINRLQDELLNMNTLLEARVAVRTEELLNSNRSLNLEIEERKQIENALRESEEKFRAISESANDGVLILDVSGIITFSNNAAVRIFGYATGEMLGLNLSVLIINEGGNGDGRRPVKKTVKIEHKPSGEYNKVHMNHKTVSIKQTGVKADIKDGHKTLNQGFADEETADFEKY